MSGGSGTRLWPYSVAMYPKQLLPLVAAVGVNESTCIAIGDVHCIANPFDEPVHIVEVQCGDYLGEDDIERLEDNYGREGTNK